MRPIAEKRMPVGTKDAKINQISERISKPCADKLHTFFTNLGIFAEKCGGSQSRVLCALQAKKSLPS